MKLKTIAINGKNYPVHFSIAALEEIEEKVAGGDVSTFLGGLQISTLRQKVTVAHIGYTEGHRLSGDTVPALSREGFRDLLTQRPEALAEIIALFFLQTYGDTMPAALAELEKLPDQEKEYQTLKNVWTALTTPAAGLVPGEYTK